MNMSEDLNQLASALVKFQAEVKTPKGQSPRITESMQI